MTRDELITICERMGACDGLDWLHDQTYATAAECWDACERGDWMIWLLTERPDVVPNRTLRLIAVDCARAVQPIADAWFAQHAPEHVGAGVRLLDLIESDPDADPQTWAVAWDAARSAAWAAAWAAASDAAHAAACAAVWAAASDAAGDAAKAVARAASDAAWSASDAARAEQARIVRARVEWADVDRGLQEVAR